MSGIGVTPPGNGGQYGGGGGGALPGSGSAGGIGGGGGIYGGGGGGSNNGSQGVGGTGGDGLIVITYTPSGGSAPTVTTDRAYTPTPSSTAPYGSITATGGSSIIQHGFAYGTDPTFASVISTTTLGTFSGTGRFSDSISSLSADQTYYVRAYATNSSCTGYGNTSSFYTGDLVPARHMRLFAGFRIKLVNDRLILL